MSLPQKILLLLLVFVAGAFAGVYIDGRLHAADEVASADAATAAITTNVNRQIAAHQAELARQQARSLLLAQDQGAIHTSVADIHLEISNARFDPPADAGSCPDPIGSDEFVRLYDDAAKGRRSSADPTATPAR